MHQTLMLEAQRGNVGFLRKAINSNPPNYFCSYTHEGYGIFHLAMRSNSCTSFIKEAIDKLPQDIVKILLTKQDNSSKGNPLHWAAYMGKLDVIRLILGVYKHDHDSSTSEKPWLALDIIQETPLHKALSLNDDDEICAMEILSMDLKLLSNMLDKYGSSPLFLAVRNGYNQVALEILNSNHEYSLSGLSGYNPFHYVPKCSENVWKLLYKKHMNLLHEKNKEGTTVLHYWALIGEPRPVILLENADLNSLKKLSGVVDKEGNTPLHLAVLNRRKEFAKCLGEKSPIEWFCQNKFGMMPLELALRQAWEDLVLDFMFSHHQWTNEELEGRWQRWVLIAIQKRMDKVVQKLLLYLMELDHSSSHVPSVDILNSSDLWALLQKHHPNLFEKLLDKTGEDGSSLVHEWAKKSEPALLQLLKEGTNVASRIKLIELRNNSGDTLLHTSIENGNQLFAKSIVEIIGDLIQTDPPPWQLENAYGKTPFDLALEHRLEEVAILIISKDCWTYRNRNSLGASRLFIAVEQRMDQVVKKICECVALESPPSFVPIDNDDGRTIVHVLSKCQESTGKLLLETIPRTIEGPEGVIDIAAQIGEEWLTKLLIAKKPSLVKRSTNAWINLCKRGHLEAFKILVENFPDFRMLCANQDDTPLHHINLKNDQEYEKFFMIPLVREMKNQRDSNGKTPLHRAVEEKDIRLAEVLLKNGAARNIRDRERITATKLLADICEHDHDWEQMVQRIGINPRLRNLGSSVADMRNTLSVVAALLATITFAAAFTIPGGFNQTSGEVILVTKASFVAFILADTYAMCCAMFVLFCLIWSMVCDEDESKLLIDRSVMALVHSFYGTLMAFMTGVFTVIHQKSLWASILIIIMCSLVAILTKRSILFRMLVIFDKSDEARAKREKKHQLIKIQNRQIQNRELV